MKLKAFELHLSRLLCDVDSDPITGGTDLIVCGFVKAIRAEGANLSEKLVCGNLVVKIYQLNF